MEPLLWLTPSERRAVPLPRWMLVPPALALLGCVAGALGDWAAVSTAGKALTAGSAVPLAWWLETRIHGALGASGTLVRIITPGLVALMAFPLLLVAGVLGLAPLGLGTFLLGFGATFVWWLAAASIGTLVVGVIDRAVSAWRARFPTRLTLAILILMSGALLLAALVSALSSSLVAAIISDSRDLKVTAGFDMTEDELKAWLRANPGRLSLALFAAAFVAAFPAVLSACAKLADAAMERLRPMSRAFALVSEGQRAVRVEERGSTEFVELAQAFNALVETLDATERMERAFGRYVSSQVLARIKAQHGQAELQATTREATVFFADIRGFTSLSEKLTPAQVVEFLNRYLARVVGQVDAHLGYLNKFIGDAVVVVFNGPLDQADHAERAVRCALALQQEVARLNAEGVLPEVGELRIGVGIATGPMVCGNVGGPTQMEYTVIGDTVNLSARLTSLAGPGEVWVSEGTAKAAPGFQYTPLPEVKLKGKEKPVTPLRAEGATR